MSRKNGGSAPFLISGGGIGGLVTAYALAHQGFPVRLFEQSPEFREVGAGIQLGPNIFRVLEKIGLKDAVTPIARRRRKCAMR
jgi:salicylate hydroxylase